VQVLSVKFSFVFSSLQVAMLARLYRSAERR
jgi:hypothetical protein